jgi:hypothetical protein
MKTKLSFIAMFLVLGITFVGLAETSKQEAQKFQPSGSPTATAQATHTWHLPAGFTADQAYKSNCTRCHAEVPKLGTRRTKTIVQHMRVRANLTQDEAQAILEYLNK